MSKEPKNPHGSFDPHDPKYLGLICLVKKCKIRFWIPSDFTIQSWIFIKKRTLAETKKRKKSRTNEAKAKETRRRQEREREEQFQLILDNYYIICHNLKSPHYLNTNIPVPPQGSRWRTIWQDSGEGKLYRKGCQWPHKTNSRCCWLFTWTRNRA